MAHAVNFVGELGGTIAGAQNIPVPGYTHMGIMDSPAVQQRILEEVDQGAASKDLSRLPEQPRLRVGDRFAGIQGQDAFDAPDRGPDDPPQQDQPADHKVSVAMPTTRQTSPIQKVLT